MAVLNNFELDVKMKCLEEDMTQQQLGEAIGSTGQYVNRVMKKKEGIVNKTFVDDITLTYTRKRVEK